MSAEDPETLDELRDRWDADMQNVLDAAEGLADLGENAPPWAGALFLRVTEMVDAGRAEGHRYRRGMQRLVGNARCSECTFHKPALTCFDNDKDGGGSCGWMVCDDCMRSMLPVAPSLVMWADGFLLAWDPRAYRGQQHLEAVTAMLRRVGPPPEQQPMSPMAAEFNALQARRAHDPGCASLQLGPQLGPSTKPCDCRGRAP